MILLKKYIAPEIEIIKFEVEDIMTTSVVGHDEDELVIVGIETLK